jgi:hypothetical protein
MARSIHDIGSGQTYFVAALDNDPLKLVATGPRLLLTIHIHNNTDAVAFVQVFDAAATTDVTLNTTVPTLSFGVAASGVANYEFSRGANFPLGIVIASTTTATGATGASTNVGITYG